MRRLSFVFVACASACLATGCGPSGPPLPETYPVHGTVAHRRGTLVTSGIVVFESKADRTVCSTGVIKEDGTYSLTTSRGRQRVEGGVAGPNHVVLTLSDSGPGGGKGPAGGAQVITLPTPYTIEPRDNEINLVVGQP